MRRRTVWALAPLALSVSCGCGSRPVNPGFTSVQTKVESLIHRRVEWPTASPGQDAAKNSAQALLGDELTVENTVQVALINNRSLRATFEELGIADADLAQAGIWKNPVFGASARFPDKGPRIANTEFSLAFDALDLLLIPLRKKLEGMRFEQAKAKVAEEVVRFVQDVQAAYYELVAAQGTLVLKKALLEAAGAAAELTQKQLAAGNIQEYTATPKLVARHQAKMDVIRAETELLQRREKLQRLMGISRGVDSWRVPDRLPDLPAAETLGESDMLESMAVDQRLDLEIRRQEVGIVDKARSLRQWGMYTAVEVGGSTERDPDGVRVTGPTLQMELPLFNRGQTDRARLRAQLRQSQDRLAALDVDVRSEVREQRAHLLASRALVEELREHLLPLRRRTVELAQQRYNRMVLGLYDLLDTKAQELSAQAELIDALRDYWVGRVELERAVGGRLPTTDVTAAAVPQPVPPSSTDAPQHDHSQKPK